MEPDEQHHGSEDYEIRRQQALERWPVAMQDAKTGKLEERDAESASDASLVESLSSRYEDIRPLDGRRATFGARDRQSGKPVQLKVRRYVSRAPQFSDVLRVLRTIPQRYRCGIQDDIALRDDAAVLVMDWLEGDTLQERIDANRRSLPEDDVRLWMEHICEAMTFLAAGGIIHRNLKPANIVIDASNVAHVNDFSLAAFAGSENRACGTFAYAAPEQLTEYATVSTCFDIYGFGAAFYHALAGEAPFKPGLDRIIEKAGMKPEDSKDLTQTLPGSVAPILARCLEAEPRKRFHSFVELRTQLESQRAANVVQPSISQPPNVPGYMILSELGRGGMGVVYKALDVQSDQYVAIKFIRTHGDANLDQLARFRIEGEAVAFLRHRNIVPVVRMGVAMGYPYIVLEYASGGSLAGRMREGSNDPVRAASVAENIARGLAHAHRLSILHRDLKPQNILLTDAGVARISDFGLAKITATGPARQHLRDASIVPGIDGSLMELMRFRGDGQATNAEDMKRRIDETVDVAWQECGPSLGDAATASEVREFLTDVVEQSFEATEDPFGHEETEPTREGQIIGTPMYMAPEQTYGDMSQLGRQTDIYSLGVILYEMLSGSVPHRATRINDLFQQIRFDAPPPLHRRVPLTLRNICEKCLAKTPGDRFQSADSLADDLHAFLESEEAEVAARRAANQGRFRKKVGNFLRGVLPFPNDH